VNGPGTAIVNAKVFDGAGVTDLTSVRFASGVITDCSATDTTRPGDEVIDAAGGTLLPGLIDTHVHLAPGALAQSLTFGVTTVLDMFSTPDVVAAARLAAASGTDVADMRSAGVGATAPGGHPSMMYDPFPTVDRVGGAELFVADRIADGVDYLKVFCGAGGRGPSLSTQTVRALVDAAHAHSRIVVAHVNSTAGVDQALSSGVDVIAHIPADSELEQAVAERIARAGVAVVPTLATIENTFGGVGGEGVPAGLAVVADPRLTEALGRWARTRLVSESSAVAARHRRVNRPSAAAASIRRLADAGALLLAGTDAPNPGTVFGASLHRELELLVLNGVRPADALAAATSGPARVFGLADRGEVAVGKRADLLLVSGDPLADITATRGIRRIWRRGRAVRRRPFEPTAAEAAEAAAFDARIAATVASVRRPLRPQI
jgi:imidazolonepropionase-like amidohydrolase